MLQLFIFLLPVSITVGNALKKKKKTRNIWMLFVNVILEFRGIWNVADIQCRLFSFGWWCICHCREFACCVSSVLFVSFSSVDGTHSIHPSHFPSLVKPSFICWYSYKQEFILSFFSSCFHACFLFTASSPLLLWRHWAIEWPEFSLVLSLGNPNPMSDP